MTKKFQRRIENFTCGHCNHEVIGDGYTNHCPNCLYSCHVDINPGDRAEECGGLMQPVGIDNAKGEWVLIHQCVKCAERRRCKTRPEDMTALLALAKKLTDLKTR